MIKDPFAKSSAPCLTCGGTGVRGGRLSGKKKCKTCHGSKTRPMKFSNEGQTIVDFTSVTIPVLGISDVKDPECK